MVRQFHAGAARRPIRSGGVIAYQSSEELFRLNPHSHALILQGGFDSSGLSSFLAKRLPPKGQLCYLPVHDTARLDECLRRGTSGLLLNLYLMLIDLAHNVFRAANSPNVTVYLETQARLSLSKSSLPEAVVEPVAYLDWMYKVLSCPRGAQTKPSGHLIALGRLRRHASNVANALWTPVGCVQRSAWP